MWYCTAEIKIRDQMWSTAKSRLNQHLAELNANLIVSPPLLNNPTGLTIKYIYKGTIAGASSYYIIMTDTTVRS